MFANVYICICIYGRFRWWWGGHSDAKWEIFQFFVDFSRISFRKGGGGYVIPFRNLQEKAVSER